MKTSTKTILMIIIFLLAGLFFGYTAGSFYKANNRSEEIIEVLKENCDCKEVNQTIYAKGIQFGKDGITTEKGEYELIDCAISGSFVKEAKRLNKILDQKVKGYKKIDHLELEFVNDNESETILIKKGKIQ